MRAKSRLSLAECRALLGADAEPSLTDEQLLRLRDRFYELAAIAIKSYQNELPSPMTLSGLPDFDRIDVEERAAIMQFEANLTREQSERLALDAHMQSKSRH